jgi:choline-sulfatase
VRILYVDIDTLRADHLGCYGYHRDTSPNIDALARRAVRFERCYASDVPCLPSRTALCTGRFGIHNGVVGHGGTAADLRLEGAPRGFWSSHARNSFARQLRLAGLRTVTLSSFADRHSAFQWYSGFTEHNMVPKLGLEGADEVFALTEDWLERNGASDDWFLHVHLWDPHTPYRAPASYGEPFADAPLPAWLSEDVRARHWQLAGPHSAQECVGFSPDYPWGDYPRQPKQIGSMDAVRQMFDGYDTGVRFADDYVGRMLAQLDALGVLEDTAIMISADHGETLGELGIYCDHHTADEHTCRVPMLLVWPGLQPRVERGLFYQIDVTATLLQLLGREVPAVWDGKGFATELRAERDSGRPYLVLSQGAWTCQRAVRFDDLLFISTLHDGYHDFPAELLFDVARDPHEQHDLATLRPADAARGRALLAEFMEANLGAAVAADPMQAVLAEGGPFHVRGKLGAYLERLRATGRAALAERIAASHPGEP